METDVKKDEGSSWLSVILYVLGAIGVIAAGVYYFMRREPTPSSAADVARKESSQESVSKSQEEQFNHDETQADVEKSDPAEESNPVQEETQTETQEQKSSEDDENNNK